MREEVRGGGSASSYTSDVHSIARGGQNSMYNVKDLKTFIDYGKYSINIYHISRYFD